MYSLKEVIFPSLIVLLLARPILGYAQYYPPAADCVEYTIPVNIETHSPVLNATRWNTQYDLEDFLEVVISRAGAGYPSPLSEDRPQTESFQIAASFCTPKNQTTKSKTVLVATHGIGPGRDHWNSAYKPDEYNFVQYAIQQGYSVFFYDRLGCGASSKTSGYTNTLFKATTVLQQLTTVVRAGQYTSNLGKPDKVALIGFSFGSLATQGAIALTPEIADAVILTGIGFNSTGINMNGFARSFVPRIANQQNPALYGDRDNGYVTWVDKFAQIHNYFKAPNYEESAIDYAEAVKQPFAIVEFLTLLAGPTDVSNYTGPVMAISGEYDYIFCDGYCPGLFDEPGRTIYRNAKFTQVLHPGASHNINFHKNATGAYKVITDFLENSGL